MDGGGYPAELQRRLAEKCREERAQARLLIALGIPFAAVTIFGMTFALSALLWFVGVRYALSFPLAFVIVCGAVAFDTWKHPSEHWKVATFYSGGVAETGYGLFRGGTVGTTIHDVVDIATQGEVMARGCANVILAGPRNIRRGIELLRAVEAKSEPKVESAAVRFLAWLKQAQPQTEEEVTAQLTKDPSLCQGFALASELGFVRRRQEGPQRLFEMKESSMREDVT